MSPWAPVSSRVAYTTVLLAILLPDLFVVFVLSAIGLGPDLDSAVASTYANLAGSCLALLTVLWMVWLFVSDCDVVSSNRKLSQVFKFVVLVLLALATTVLRGVVYPWAATFTCVFLSVVMLGIFEHRVLRGSVVAGQVRENRDALAWRAAYYRICSLSFLLCSLALVIVWIAWVIFAKRDWSTATKRWLAAQNSAVYAYVLPGGLDHLSGCGPGAPEGDDVVEEACHIAESVWLRQYIAPLLVATCNVMCAAFGEIFVVVLSREARASSAERKHDLVLMLERCLISVVLTISFMYCSLYVAGASAFVSESMMALAVIVTAMLFGWIYTECDHSLLEEVASELPLAGTLWAIVASDWAKAVAVGCLNVSILALAGLDVIRKRLRVRRHRKQPGAVVDPSDRFTVTGRRMVDLLMQWNWTSIFLKMCVICEFMVTMILGMKFGYVFFAFLNTELERAGHGVETVFVLCFVIGLGIFMCPIMPGSAVYLFSGIVLGGCCSRPWWEALLLGTALSSAAKLLACLGQYLLGLCAGRSLKVQMFVGVDRVATRATEKILKQRGMGLGKVCILVAGPDFPTSMLCGILRLNIPQMLLGTLPVILVSVAPQTLVGVLLVQPRSSEADTVMWGAISGVATGLAAASQAAATMTFVYMILKKVDQDAAELSTFRPEHTAVVELRGKEEASVKVFEELCGWERLGLLQRGLLLCASASHLLSFVLVMADFVVAEKFCFRPFNISNKIHLPYNLGGLNNNALNLVFPVGWVAIALFSLGVMLQVTFYCWLSAEGRALESRGRASRSRRAARASQKADAPPSVVAPTELKALARDCEARPGPAPMQREAPATVCEAWLGPAPMEQTTESRGSEEQPGPAPMDPGAQASDCEAQAGPMPATAGAAPAEPRIDSIGIKKKRNKISRPGDPNA